MLFKNRSPTPQAEGDEQGEILNGILTEVSLQGLGFTPLIITEAVVVIIGAWKSRAGVNPITKAHFHWVEGPPALWYSVHA